MARFRPRSPQSLRDDAVRASRPGHALLAMLGCVLGSAPAVGQPVIAISTFDSGTEGWTVQSMPGGVCTLPTARTNRSVTWQSSGGSSGGFLRHVDSGDSSYFRAPPSFRGDLSLAMGGSLQAERRYNSTDPDVYQRYEDVHIESPHGTLVGNWTPPGNGIWTTQRLEFLPGFWRMGGCQGEIATEDQIALVLSEVTDIYICAEYVDGGETNDIDSVVLAGPTGDQLCELSWTEVDVATPSARWRHAMAIDSDRGVLVLFGGASGEVDTWEYDLLEETWTRYETAVRPSRKNGHAMAYDAARQKIVLTGGGYFAATAEVWEYDVETHTWAEATPLPQARGAHAMAYDSHRRMLVLYGGLASGVAGATEVLERSETSDEWVARSAAFNPSPQSGHAMAFDSGRGKMVLVDSRSNSVGLVNVYEWDGILGEWSALTFMSGPDPRLNPVLVFDEARSRIVLAGGEGQLDTWEFDGVAWTRRADLPGSAGRDEHSAAFDPITGRVFAFGGLAGSSSPTRALVAFSGGQNQWAVVTPNLSPSPRVLAPIAFDEVGGRTILYGGGVVTRPGTVQAVSGVGYSFDGVTWSTLVTSTPDGAPPMCWAAPLVYAPSRGTMILYGGQRGNTVSTAMRSVWELDLATLTWHDRTPQPTTPPGQRISHAAAFDRVRGQMVVHGGVNESSVRLGDTWTYDPDAGTWTQALGGGASPGIRAEAAMAFDEARGVVVLFGGVVGPSGQIYDETTWEWNGSEWRDATPSGPSPRGRRRATLVYDADHRAVVLLGGNISLTGNNAPPLADVWKFDGRSWTPLNQPGITLNPARWLANVTFDRVRREIVHVGGQILRNGDTTTGQTWLGSLGCSETCLADYNGSGEAGDILDFLDFFEDFGTCQGQSAPCGTLGDPDFNGDTIIDILDFLDFFEAFGQGC